MKGIVCYIVLYLALSCANDAKEEMDHDEKSSDHHDSEPMDHHTDHDYVDHESLVIYDHNDTFAKGITEKYNFLMFTTPGSGHCRQVSPAWNELAELYDVTDSLIVVSKVDCKRQKELCVAQNVKEFPTIRLYKKKADDFIAYQGKRTFIALHKFVEEQLHKLGVLGTVNATDEELQSSVELRGNQFHHFVERNLHFVLFYTQWCAHCKSMFTAWHELADNLGGGNDVFVSHLNCEKYGSICSDSDIKGFPSIVVFHNGEKVHEHKGDRSLSDLEALAHEMIEKYVETPDEGAMEVDVSAGVNRVTDETFENFISEGLVFVNFHLPKDKENQGLASEWKKLATAMHEKDVLIGQVDCSRFKDTCQESEVTKYPSLILFQNGVRLDEYEGEKNATALEKYLESFLVHEEL